MKKLEVYVYIHFVKCHDLNLTFLQPTSKFGKIAKSRYDSISLYLSKENNLKSSYNDLDVPINQGAYDELIEAGIDPLLARHIAHLFIRDPLVIYDNRIEIDAETNSDHFEVSKFIILEFF